MLPFSEIRRAQPQSQPLVVGPQESGGQTEGPGDHEGSSGRSLLGVPDPWAGRRCEPALPTTSTSLPLRGANSPNPPRTWFREMVTLGALKLLGLKPTSTSAQRRLEGLS